MTLRAFEVRPQARRAARAAFLVGLALVLVLQNFVPQIASAATGAPRILNYQGRLFDSNGNLLGGAGTDYCFKFSLYDSPTVGSGTQVWPSLVPSTMTVPVADGVFNAAIGDTTAGGDTLDYNFQDNNAVYLNVEVAAQISGSCSGVTFETLSPRERVLSSGFAINANTVGGFTPAQEATGNEIPVLESGTLVLGGSNPFVNATSTNPLTFQGGGWATGNIQFFNSSNWINSGGNASFTGAVAAAGISATNATTTMLAVTGTASTSNLVVSNGFTFGDLNGILKAVAGVVTTAFVNLATDVTGILPVGNGGTGWAYIAAGAIPYGNGSGALSTTSAAQEGQVLAFIGGAPTWTATTTYAAPLSWADGTVALPQASSTSNGYLAASDWATFSNKVSSSSLDASLAAVYPFADAGNSTSTLTQFGGGITAYASTTLGGGTQASGLTVNGGATTTGTSYFENSVAIGTSSPAHRLEVSGSTFLGGDLTATGIVSFSNGLGIGSGGTGTSTVPSYGDLLVGNALGGYDLVATSSLGIASASSTLLFDNNTWTGLQLFRFASSTAFSASNLFAVGRLSTTTIRGDGATSTFAGPLSVGTGISSYLVSVFGSTTAPAGQAGSAVMAISNNDTSQSSGNNVLRLNIGNAFGTSCSSGTTCPRFVEFFAGVPNGSDTGGTGIGNIRLSNNGSGITQTSGSADYAEYMQLNSSASTGDLVSLNASGQYQQAVAGQSIVGVVSNSPAFVGNGNIAGNTDAYVVGFAGVIPTTVSAANGAIGAGDFITASTTAGVGVKLTESGYTLGQALQSFSGTGTSTIEVLVLPKYIDAAVALESYGGTSGGQSGYWDLATSTGLVSLASSTYSLALTNATTTAFAISSLANSLLAVNGSGSLIASSTIGANLISGALGSVNGQTLTRGGSITVDAASSTLLADSNTWAGLSSFKNASTTLGTITTGWFSNLYGGYASTTAVSATSLCLTGSSCISSWPTGGSGAWPFTAGLSTYGTSTQATTTPFWFQGGLFSSSTSAIPALAVSQNGTGPVALFDGGSVGIGTTSPWAKLAVEANVGDTNTMLFQIASSTGSATASLFSVSNTGLTTVGDSSGSGDANLQFGSDANAWNIGYDSADKSFRIASSTNFTTGTMFSISKSGVSAFYGNVQLGALANCGGALKTDASGQIFCGAAGGLGGSGLWATSTNDQLIYPTIATVPVVVGETSTTTTGNIFEANGSALFRGAVTAYNAISAPTFSATSTTASSTFANGINLTSGCFSVNGTCVGGAGGSSASSTLLSDNNTFGGIDRFSNLLNLAATSSSLLATDASGNVIATSTIGANLISGTFGVSHGGTGAASFAYGLLLANGTNALTNIATSSLGLLTTDVAEGSNLYFTPARVDTELATFGKGYFFSTTSAQYFSSLGLGFSTTSANAYLSTKTTDSLAEGATNLYFTNTRAASYISSSSTIPHIGGSSYGNLLSWSGTSWGSQATSTLGISLGDTTGILGAGQGGTGTSTYQTGDILYASGANTLTALPAGSPGQVLKMTGGIPQWGIDLTSGGGGGGGLFSTTTDGLVIYPTNTSNVVVIGASATSSTNLSMFEVAGRSYFSDAIGIATTSAGSLLSIGGVANLTTGTSTFYGNGGINLTSGCFSVNGTCVGGASGSSASSTLLSDNNTFGGIDRFSNLLNLAATSSSLLATDASGNVIATTTIGANLISGTLGVSNGGTGAASFSYGLLLGNGTNALATIATSSLGLQTTNVQEGSNLYYTPARVDTELGTFGKGYFFSTTSAQYFSSLGLGFSTTSSSYFLSQDQSLAFSTSSAGYFLGANQNLAFSTSSENFYLQASTTVPKTYSNNVWSGIQSYSQNVGLGTTSPWAKLAVQANSGETNTMLFQIASSTGSATTSLFSVDNTGLTTIGDSSGTGDALFQFAGDNNAWSVGYRSTDKSFVIASSTNFSGTAAFAIAKNGNATFVGSGGTCTINGSGNCTSDKRLKTNIMWIGGADALTKLGEIHGITYNWADPALNQSQRIGVIAQDVQKAFPDLVGSTTVDFKGTPGTYLTVDYGGLTAPLITAMNYLSNVYSVSDASTSAPSISSSYQGTTTPALSIAADGGATFGGGLTVIGGATFDGATSSDLYARSARIDLASVGTVNAATSSIGSLTALSASLASATTTHLAVTGLPSGLIAVDANGSLVPVSIDPTLALEGSTTLSLNLSRANIWSGLQVFGYASTTALSVRDFIGVGSTSPTTIRGDQATSTFAGGVSIANGCFAINGVCIGGGGNDDRVMRQAGNDAALPRTAASTSESNLSFPVKAGETWVFDYALSLAASSTKASVQAAVFAPNAASCSVDGSDEMSAATTSDCTTPGEMQLGLAGTATSFAHVRGVVTAASGGDVMLEISSQSASAPVTLEKGSALVAYRISGGDIADVYSTNDASLSAGTIVAIDTALTSGIKRADRAAGDHILGVVSNAPRLILGSLGHATSSVALVSRVGRTSVAVDLENGPIAPGDRIALSSTPGVGMKATQFDDSAGIALEAFNGQESATGTIELFVQPERGIDINALAMTLLDSTSSLSASSTSSPSMVDFVGGMMDAIGKRVLSWDSAASSTSTSTAASSTSPTDVLTKDFMESIKSMISSFLADTTNGIGQIVAITFHAQRSVCVGSECLTADDIAALHQMRQPAAAANSTVTSSANASGVAGSGTVSLASTSTAGTASSSAPVIVINGNNPATVSVGSTYTDLGATIVSPAADVNLGIQTIVDGVVSQGVTIDTSTAGDHTVLYRVTDQNGVASEAVRTVQVINPTTAIVTNGASSTASASTASTSTLVIASAAATSTSASSTTQ